MVLPDGILSMENGDPQEFDIEVHDVSGNLTTQPKLQVVCKVRFHKKSCNTIMAADCMSHGDNHVLCNKKLPYKYNQCDFTIAVSNCCLNCNIRVVMFFVLVYWFTRFAYIYSRLFKQRTGVS